MRQRDREAQVDLDLHSDPHSLLFGDDEPAAGPASVHGQHGPLGQHGLAGSAQLPNANHGGEPPRHGRHSRVEPEPERRRRGKRALWILLVVGLLVVVAAAWLVVPKITALVHPPDYAGSGTGSVRVAVQQGDTAADIAATLHKAGVVKSDKAFTDAASDDSASENIQPGTYTLHEHMSAKKALSMLLDPASRTATGDVLVTEGATTFDVEARLAKVLGPDKQAAIAKAMGDVAALGIPLGYAPQSGKVTSVEGFLYPATYSIDPTSSPAEALQKMTTRFADADRSSGFATAAKRLGISPYQALIVASIAQSEAKYPADMAKVARVILNRLAANTPLKIDATTRYGALVQGVDPDKVTYSTFSTPYNSYTHGGLPPTPISNPGAQALEAAVHPATGNWLYYVNSDAAGHLFFTADENAFAAAAAKCRDNNWGCG